MGLSFLGTAQSLTLQTTHSFTGLSFGVEAPNRHVIACILADENEVSAFGISSASIGGVTATSVGQLRSGSGGADSYMILAAVPTGTSGTISITFNGVHQGCFLAAYRTTGLVSPTPFDTATDTGDPITMSIDVPENGIIIACATFLNEDAAVSTSGITEDYDSNPYNRVVGGSATNLTAETGRTVSFNGDLECSGLCASWQVRESLILTPSIIQPFHVM